MIRTSSLSRRSLFGLSPRVGLWGLAGGGALIVALWSLAPSSGLPAAWGGESERAPDARRSVLDRRPPRRIAEPVDLVTPRRLLAASLQDLDALVRANPSAARKAGERDILAAWARAYSDGKTGLARAVLDRAGEIAARLPAANGRLLAEGVRVIRAAGAHGDEERLGLLARGQLGLVAGVALHVAEDYAQARTALDRAMRDLRRAGTPLALSAQMARLWADPGAGPDLIDSLISAAEARGDSGLAAEGTRRLAWHATVQGRLDDALGLYREARDRFERLGEWEEAAVVRAMEAEILAIFGRHDEASFELQPALRVAAGIADPLNRFNYWTVASSTALAVESPLAFAYRERAVGACAELSSRPLCGVDSWIGFARRTMAPELAERALERAAGELDGLPSSLPGRKRTEIELDSARARWLARDGFPNRDPERAASLLGEVAERFQTLGLPVSAVLALDDRAGILERLGRSKESRSESRRALDLVLGWGQGGSEASAEAAIPGILRHLYERLIRLALSDDEGRGEDALFLSDEMRDRLAPRLGATFQRFDSVNLDRLLAALPPRTAVVEYALIAGSGTGSPPIGVAWVLTDGHLEQITVAAGSPLAGQLAELHAIRADRPVAEAWKITAGALYAAWIEPVRAVLPADIERLVLVPDSELYGIPWRGLWNASTGRYLDEELTVSLAPSLASLQLPVGPVVPIESIAALGFSRFGDLGLKDLPGALREAGEVVSAYPASAVPCAALTWPTFRQCAAAADVLHLATHANSDSRLKGGSWIAFGGEQVSAERLWRELPALPRTRLVVLSACETAATATGEGLGGLARPFLAPGARAVVGTLWNLGDKTALEFFPMFHGVFARREDAAAALREARAELGEWQRKPWKWAGAVALDTELR